ncbi:sugar transporter family protein [Mycobacterium tuberculosis CAS/NITR204]|uniref:Sugar transporter family protein n=1 Tax=Mycobacterium tuberculosis CAS/NITR204 TaxID=1310114 RepID=R4MMR5_MYCTX|nr:sugar transporter family protein [Mycobacterium tuberculosis CAS/NITR204]
MLSLSEEFELTTREQELLTTTAVLGQIAGALGGGILANAIGRKKSVVLIVAGYAVFALLGATSVSVPMLVVARLLLGVTIGCRWWWCRCMWPSRRRRRCVGRW